MGAITLSALRGRLLLAQFVSVQYKIGLKFDSFEAWIETLVVHKGKQYSCKQEDFLC